MELVMSAVVFAYICIHDTAVVCQFHAQQDLYSCILNPIIKNNCKTLYKYVGIAGVTHSLHAEDIEASCFPHTPSNQ
jgi:hypothetical protein